MTVIDLEELAERMIRTVRNGGTSEEIKQEFMRSAKLLMEKPKCRSRLGEQEPKIIRCKDCKHGADTVINGEYLFKTCGGVNHKPDWFCADGERR